MAKKAILVGASGLIGSELLTIILADDSYSEVLVLARKKVKIKNNKLIQKVIDFNFMDEYAEFITGDVIFCCLGTTLSQTPDKKLYRKIDHDYPVNLAKIALQNGIGQFHLVSSLGANAQSKQFYLKTKGETENDVKKVGLKSVHIYEPSVLDGLRNHPRPMEVFFVGLMNLISPLLNGKYKKYRSIKGSTVAMAMFKQSIKNEPGVFTYTSDVIQELA
jgi:uncharacterized protein YbjT (DUF2867 family)